MTTTLQLQISNSSRVEAGMVIFFNRHISEPQNVDKLDAVVQNDAVHIEASTGSTAVGAYALLHMQA